MNESRLDATYSNVQKTFGEPSINEHPVIKPRPTIGNQPYGIPISKDLAYRAQTMKNCDHFKDGCMKHLLLDIYMKILPFDDDYVDGNKKMCQHDVDSFLRDKNMTAGQYFQSACKETKAPLLEYVIRAVNELGKEFVEKAEEKAKEAKEADIDVPAPEVEEDEIDSQIVDVKDDIEYEDFITKLKRKTINKIVKDISALINDKKDEKEMTFSPEVESVKADNFIVSLDYISESLMKKYPEAKVDNDDIIALAIRESTLHTLDEVFSQPNSSLREFTTKLRLGKGVIITESVLEELTGTLKA